MHNCNHVFTLTNSHTNSHRCADNNATFVSAIFCVGPDQTQTSSALDTGFIIIFFLYLFFFSFLIFSYGELRADRHGATVPTRYLPPTRGPFGAIRDLRSLFRILDQAWAWSKYAP